ncbi:MAG: hypothetical protein WBD20_21165 [Pirellulaceae bacterium]
MLRKFDLQRPLFQKRLSYLVNSQTFADVDPMLQQKIAEQIWDSVAETPRLVDVIEKAGPTWLREFR